jgi:hypothetical protein
VRVIAAVAQEIGSEIARQDQPTFAHQANVLRHPRAVAAH